MLAGEFAELENWRSSARLESGVLAHSEHMDSDGYRWHDYLEISTRTRNMIEREKIESLDQIDSMTDQELLWAYNFGKKSLEDLRGAVKMRRQELAQLSS